MTFKIWILLLTSLLLLSCGEKEVQDIGLEDAVFKAVGNNPSWKLEIDSNNGIHFYSSSELGKIITPSSEIIKVENVATINYSAETETVIINVEIFRKQCIDKTNHKEYKYAVKVSAKKSGTTEFTTFKGCGDFIE